MAESFTSRLGLPEWSVDTDPFITRAQWNAAMSAIDGGSAIFAAGTAAARPAFGVSGRFYLATDTGAITYDTGSAWTAVTVTLAELEALFTADQQILMGSGSGTGSLVGLLAAVEGLFTGAGQILQGTGAGAGQLIGLLAAVEALFTGAGQLLVGTGAGAGELLAPGALGTVLMSNGAAAVPSWQAPSAGAMQLISSQVLGSAAASVTFSSIPATFNHLLLVAAAKSAVAANYDALYFQLNGDTAANYSVTGIYLSSGGTTPTGVATAGYNQVWGRGDDIFGASIAAATPGVGELWIPRYAGTVLEKVGSYKAGGIDKTSGGNVWNDVRWSWNSTAAVSSVKVFTASTANLIAGSAFYLYGIT